MAGLFLVFFLSSLVYIVRTLVRTSDFSLITGDDEIGKSSALRSLTDDETQC